MAAGMDCEGAPGPETVPVLFPICAEEKNRKNTGTRAKNPVE